MYWILLGKEDLQARRTYWTYIAVLAKWWNGNYTGLDSANCIDTFS
jgi:hypothetical protein